MALPFGPYEVLARLATGGAANIFLARQAHGGVESLVCLKTLLPERARDQEFVEMFLDEARLAARLNHPSCVAIYDLGREAGTYYISMEYILGETLWALLATVAEFRTALPPSTVASILVSAAEGLHHAHELKDAEGRPYQLVHRDVSPQNIMVGYDGRTKVVDFGIAKAETGREATATGIVKGKFSYMSPEQITGGTIDRRSDVYSLGIVMFECLASRRLYRAEAPEEIARMMLEKRPPKLRDVAPEVPAALEAICSKALSRHPGARFQTAREMADALRDHLHAQRFSEGPEPVAGLMRERFGLRVDQRRRMLQRALEGDIDEAELIESLGARPVMELDLYASPRETTETLREEPSPWPRRDGFTGSIAGTVRSVEDKIPVPVERESPAKHGKVELLVGEDSAERVELKEMRRLSSDVDHEEATRLDGEVEDGRTALDEDTGGPGDNAETLRPSELPIAHPRRRSEVRAGESKLRVEPPLREISMAEPVSLVLPRVNAPPTPLSPPLEEAMVALPISVTGLGRAAQMPAEISLAPAIPMPPPAAVAPAAVLTQPPGAPLAPTSRPPTVTMTQAYSLGVVLAAMAFGVTLGLLLGVVLTLYR
ncbi:MAG: protein kinase [Myxococcota bacterium]